MTPILEHEPLEYQMTRKKAQKMLKQAHLTLMTVYQKNAQQNLFEFSPIQSNLRFVYTTLVWAGTLNVSEKKWLDSKISLKTQQLSRQAIKFKSPIRMCFSLLLSLTTDQISQKKSEISHLRKMQYDLRKMKPLSLALSASLKQSFSEQIISKDFLLKLIGQKLKRYEKELVDLETLKMTILDRSLRLFFNEWKQKTQEIDMGLKNLRFFGMKGQSKATPNPEMPRATDGLETSEEERQFSIEDLENYLHTIAMHTHLASQGMKSREGSDEGLDSENESALLSMSPSTKLTSPARV